MSLQGYSIHWCKLARPVPSDLHTNGCPRCDYRSFTGSSGHTKNRTHQVSPRQSLALGRRLHGYPLPDIFHSKMLWAHVCTVLSKHTLRILLLTPTELHQVKTCSCGRAWSSVTTNSTGQSRDLIFHGAEEQKFFGLQSCRSSVEIPRGFERTHRDVSCPQLCNCLL